MYRRLAMASAAMVLAVVGSAMAQQPEVPKVNSWSNSKTADPKTTFQVKPGEKIIFSIKAEGAEKYLWQVNGKPQQAPNAESFKWTVPARKGMWKILVKTTNKAREQWVKDRAVLWKKWMSGKEKEKFIQDMIDLNIYQINGQTEWTVSTFLTKVNPGESIQKAIDSLPPEGGIVELAPGVHEITDTLYPKGTFHFSHKNTPKHYSIIIKRSNVAICGTRKSVVRHHSKDRFCFLVPDLEATDPNLYIENITFRGFTASDNYTKKDRRSRGHRFIVYAHVKNLTVEDIHDTTWTSRYLAGSLIVAFSHPRYSWNITYRNNVMEHSGLSCAHARDVHILNNIIRDGSRTGNTALYCDTSQQHIHVIGNYVRGGANKAFTTDGGAYWEVRNNDFGSSQSGMWLQQGAKHVLVENNTVTGTTRHGILIYPQGALDDVMIVNNRIYNNSGHGIYSQEYAGARRHGIIRIVNNVICSNGGGRFCKGGGDGIRANTERQTLIVSDNIIANNKGHGINPLKGKIISRYNNIWNNARGNYNGCAAARLSSPKSGQGDFSKDPLFADPSKGDFHLKSKAGRWEPKAKKWVKDSTISPCIDAGDPKGDFSVEPPPNGGRVNTGAYGNTIEASMSLMKHEGDNAK